MKYPENVKAIAACGIDYMGFIFYEKSKRFVGKDFKLEKELIDNNNLVKVGVFVNESTKNMLTTATTHHLNAIQLHGNESVEQCKELKEKGYTIIKAFQIDSQFDFGVTKSYKKWVDFFLFDTKSENFGGTGLKYDWSILTNYDNEIPLFLSGGLGLDSIEGIKKLKGINIQVLDLNSKFELEPGLKDTAKIKMFIENIN